MPRKIGLALALAGVPGFATDANRASTATPKTAPVNLSAAEIASRNAAARRGLQAWLAAQILSEAGRPTAGGNQRVPQPADIPGAEPHVNTVPTSPRLKGEAALCDGTERPRMLHLELKFNGTTVVQVYGCT